MTLRVLVRNGTNHRKLVPCYLIISLAKMFRYGPPGPKFLESTSLQGAWTHFSFVETGNDWRTNEVHCTPYENKSHHPSFQMFGRFGYEIKQDGRFSFLCPAALHKYILHKKYHIQKLYILSMASDLKFVLHPSLDNLPLYTVFP